MPELTTNQISALVELLDARQQTLESTAQEHAALRSDNSQPDATSPAGDIADQAEIEMVRFQANAAAGREELELRSIQEALARIGSGEAGICSDCGDEISFERLHVQPTAARCIFCQNFHEHLPRVRLDTKFSAAERTWPVA